MKIEIEISDNLGYSLTDDKGNILKFEELGRGDQIKVLNAFSQGYNFLIKFLKEE